MSEPAVPSAVSISEPGARPSPVSPWKRAGILAAVLVAGGYFLARGPLRALALPDGSIDFRYCFYVALRTFAQGGDPYQAEDLVKTALTLSDRHRDLLLLFYKGAILYPPAFFILAPIGLLPLTPAVWLWLLAQCCAYAALLWLSAQLFRGSWSWFQNAAFLACGLSLAPAHTNIAVGNTGILFAALTAALFFCFERRLAGWGGVVLGLLMIKPTFGIPAAALVAIRGEWRLLFLGGAVSVLTSVPAFWRVGAGKILAGMIRNLSVHTAPGMPNDETLLNPFHYQFLNLRSWFYGLTGRGWAELLTAFALGAMLYGLFRFRREREGDGRAPYWTLASVFICLSMYHVFYDGALLVVPLAAAFDLYRRNSKRAWGWGLALLPFAAPGTTWMHLKFAPLAHPPALFEALVVRHETVALMLLTGLALEHLARSRSGIA